MDEVIIGNIGVTAPYYALENLTITKDEVSAEFAAEQPMENEAGGIAAAEVGRHLAVLGACALARSNPVKKKHYYIALSAVLCNENQEASVSSLKFTGIAKTLDIDKRNGTVSARLMTQDKTLLYTLTTSYYIMSEPLFQKLFNAKKQECGCSVLDNPYKNEFPLSDIRYSDHTIHARFGPFRPEDCSGHFISYPCIPVAILMHGLSRSAGKLLGKIVGDESLRYNVVSADVTAETFAFAGEDVHMASQYLGRENNDYLFSCKAERQDGTQYGSMMLKLSRA